MLSPHEFATLMLVRQAPDQIDMKRAELDALLERQLVMLEHGASGRRQAHLTHKGRLLLDALDPDSPLYRGRMRKEGRNMDYGVPLASAVSHTVEGFAPE